MTVRGPVRASDMGLSLTHEHLYADVRSAQEQAASPAAPDQDDVVAVVLPHLRRLRDLGLDTFVDATATQLGRNPIAARRLSEASGLNIIVPTGVYLAADGRFIPDYARSESADELAARWIGEWRNGIDDTGVRPGFMKLGVNGVFLREPPRLAEVDVEDLYALNALEAKALRAAGRAHLQTGLTVGVHTSPWAPSQPNANGRAAVEQLAILEQEGVSPSAWIWIHAHNESVITHQIEAAKRGAFISFDGYRPGEEARYLEFAMQMKNEGVLANVLMSQDAGWYTYGEPGGGANFAPYDPLLITLIPALRAGGLTDADIDQIFIRNPAEAFAVRVRAA